MKNILCLLGCILLVSCASSPKRITMEEVDEEFAVSVKNPLVLVEKTSAPIKVDGKLDEPAWHRAQAYDLKPCLNPGGYTAPKRLDSISKAPYQKGAFRILHDAQNIYVGVELEDTDVVSYADKDQTELITRGDTIELFFKSKKAAPHWELYGTPNGKKATLLQHGMGEYCYDIYSVFRQDFTYAVTIQGTLNDYKNKDRGYTMEFVVPIKMLEDITGVKVNNKGEWTLLVSRYNYTAAEILQFSSYPPMPQIHYHLKEYYADMLFE